MESDDRNKLNYELEIYRNPTVDDKTEENAPENDGVNLQCINSSDFVVGKQTTFNGPVTIINYIEGSPEKIEEIHKPSKEEVILREKVITPATVTEIKNFAARKIDNSQKEKNKSISKRIIKAQFLKIPILLWILLVLVVIIGSLAYFLGKDSVNKSIKEEKKYMTINYNGKDHIFFSRADWNARQPLSRIELKWPIPYIVISHSATRFCYLPSVCIKLIRDMQGDHMNRSPVPFSDIAYSFMVGGDGNIYEGRGWKTKTATTGFANGKSLNINFLGSFENFDAPTYPQTEAVKALIEYGLNNSYIDENYSLIADNETYPTLSPGIQVYEEIKNWHHFDPNPKSHLTSQLRIATTQKTISVSNQKG